MWFPLDFVKCELCFFYHQILIGDSLAADYLICHLVSRIYLRRDVLTLGKFSVNLFNVPLNDRLDVVDPRSEAGAAFWQTYLRTWTRWNHLRTVACTLSTALFIAALQA